MKLADGFIYLRDIDAGIIEDIKYATCDNFLGRKVTSYQSHVCIIPVVVAKALAGIQMELIDKGQSLKVFDCYRPQRASDEFLAWSKNERDQIMKPLYYPNINKKDIFELGYLSKKSAHSRGSAVDLTIVDLASREELDMGTPFDFMDEASYALSKTITGHAKENRLLLRKLMVDAGFEPLETEWWHFRYKNEPFPGQYFDFPVL